MVELALTAITPRSANLVRPGDLTWGQGFRYDVGLPWQGAQPAFVYIEVTDRDPKWINGKPDHSQAMIGAVPKNIDVSTRKKQMELLCKFESRARDLIAPTNADRIRILQVVFQPPINDRGLPAQTNDIGIAWSTPMDPFAKSHGLQGFLPLNNPSNTLTLTR